MQKLYFGRVIVSLSTLLVCYLLFLYEWNGVLVTILFKKTWIQNCSPTIEFSIYIRKLHTIFDWFQFQDKIATK